MLKKWLLLFFASMTLAACGTTTTEEPSVSESVASTVQEDPETITVTISIAVDGEEIEGGNQTLNVEPGAILLDVLKENFEVVEEDGYITSINGHEQVTNSDNDKYWLFDVNGEMGLVGAADLELNDGDLVEFNLAGI